MPVWLCRLRLTLTGVAAALALAACPSADPRPPVGSVDAAAFSLLATGDTGKRHRYQASLFEGQLSVAAGMVVEDQREEVDALVLLGDNFYMEGLLREELVPRVRQNIVVPYCHFLALDGPRSNEVRDACPIAREQRHAIPLYAVLGNHDVVSPESPGLQSTAIPEFVPNWSLDTSFGRVIEFPQGISLILLNSAGPEARWGSDRLVDLLRQARGRWRVVAAHRPPSIDELGREIPIEGYRGYLREAFERAQTPVHAFLAGHHHSLQLLVSAPPDPSLVVIAGSGARHRAIEADHPDRVFGLASLGFARLDLHGAGDDERLFVTLFAVSDFPMFAAAPALVARWSVDLSGHTRDEL